jgi:hypothetical protein
MRPVTDDTRRQLAASDDTESAAERRLAMVCDTPRHARLGLHNHRAPIRFLSPLPSQSLDLWWLRLHWV